jgi:hypothetical protein
MTATVPETFGGIPISQVRHLEPKVKMLIYGKPGVGKTRLAASASRVPEMAPVLHLSTDAAERETMRKFAPEVHTQVIAHFNQFWNIRNDLAAAVTSDPPMFRTVILDTGTEAQKVSMSDIMMDLMKKGRPGGGEVNPDVPSQREWGQSMSEMRRLIRTLRDFPIHFIMTCHEAESRENSGLTWHKPDLPGKMANQVSGMFSNVLYLYIKSETEQETGSYTKVVTRERHLALTGLTEGYYAKSRTGELPRVMEDPTMDELFRLITAGGGE